MKKTVLGIMALLMFAMVGMTSCEKEIAIENDGEINGHGYVDLGLPSGTLWATCNVGAITPEGYGDYYAWAETEPKYYYKWDNYKYCVNAYSSLTKYCYSSEYGYNGYTDTLMVLEREDDAASVIWGGLWRTPTDKEYLELAQHTTSELTTLNGINGRKLTAKNGKSIFLPYAGCYRNGELEGVDECGFYWTSSLCPPMPNMVNGGDILWSYKASNKYFATHNNSGGSENPRYQGFSIRPVCSR